jgi:hypothetical protein
MVELTFVSRAKNFVPLALLKYISESSTLPAEIDYIGDSGAKAIKGTFPPNEHITIITYK